MFRVITELTPRWIVAENVPGILRIAAADVIADLESAGYHAVVFVYEAAAVGALHRRARVAFVANRDDAGIGAPGREADGNRAAKIKIGKIFAQHESGRYSPVLGDTEHDGLSAAAVAGVLAPTSGNDPQGQDASREPAGAGVPGNRSTLANPDLARLQGRKCESVPECAGKRTSGTRGASKPLVDDPDCVRRRRDARRRQFAQLADGRWWAAEPGVGRVAHGISRRVDRIKALGNAVVPAQFYPIFKAIWEVEHENRLT